MLKRSLALMIAVGMVACGSSTSDDPPSEVVGSTEPGDSPSEVGGSTEAGDPPPEVGAAPDEPTAVFSISGRVTSAGSPFAGIRVVLSGSSVGSTVTDAYGEYVFTGLINGTYTVAPQCAYVFSPARSTQSVEDSDATGVDFTAVILPLTPASPSTEDLPPAITSAPGYIRMY